MDVSRQMQDSQQGDAESMAYACQAHNLLKPEVLLALSLEKHRCGLCGRDGQPAS